MIFRSIDIVKELIERTKTDQGLKVVARITNKIYETGSRACEKFKASMPIVFDDFLSKWNYRAVPQ